MGTGMDKLENDKIGSLGKPSGKLTPNTLLTCTARETCRTTAMFHISTNRALGIHSARLRLVARIQALSVEAHLVQVALAVQDTSRLANGAVAIRVLRAVLR